MGMDCCHEVSACEDTGIDELFQVIARKLIERRGDIERERLFGPGESEYTYEAGVLSDNDVQLSREVDITRSDVRGSGCNC